MTRRSGAVKAASGGASVPLDGTPQLLHEIRRPPLVAGQHRAQFAGGIDEFAVRRLWTMPGDDGSGGRIDNPNWAPKAVRSAGSPVANVHVSGRAPTRRACSSRIGGLSYAGSIVTDTRWTRLVSSGLDPHLLLHRGELAIQQRAEVRHRAARIDERHCERLPAPPGHLTWSAVLIDQAHVRHRRPRAQHIRSGGRRRRLGQRRVSGDGHPVRYPDSPRSRVLP